VFEDYPTERSVCDWDVGVCSMKGNDIRIMNVYDISGHRPEPHQSSPDEKIEFQGLSE
jgi:hypothetical protein